MSQHEIYEAVCPECEYLFKIESPEINELINCDDCGLKMSIIGFDPQNKSVQLEMTQIEADDWGE
jgi:lysine biosynthesis protein LysW